MIKTILKSLVRIGSVGLGAQQPEGNRVLELFQQRCQAMQRPRVLELGTARVDPRQSSRRDSWVPHAAEYLGADIRAGADVDIVADVHRMADILGDEQFDVVISCSTFEHYKYPHLAAHHVMRVLRVGGIAFVHTHQSFPLHAHPHDFFRFSREALAGCFNPLMGVRIVASDYEFPARIVGRGDPHAALAPAFMYVRMLAEKVEPTPLEYRFDL